MNQEYGRSPWLDDQVHEAVGRLTVILELDAKDAVILLRALATEAGVGLTEAAKTLNNSGLDDLRAMGDNSTSGP